MRARNQTFCFCFVCVCFLLFIFFVRITPVQTGREKSPWNSFYFLLICRKSKGIGISPRLRSVHRFNPGGTTVTIKPNTNGNYYSGRQFEMSNTLYVLKKKITNGLKSPTNKRNNFQILYCTHLRRSVLHTM